MKVPYHFAFYSCIFFLMYTSCMPVPPIQSPEVEDKIKIGFSYAHTKDRFEYVIKDTANAEIDNSQFIPGFFGVKFEINVGERVSLNTAIIPLLLINYWDAGIKCQIVKYDHHRTPANVALSLFMHTNGSMNIAMSGGSASASFGIIAGKKILPDLEIVCMPSLSIIEIGKSLEGNNSIAPYGSLPRMGSRTSIIHLTTSPLAQMISVTTGVSPEE